MGASQASMHRDGSSSSRNMTNGTSQASMHRDGSSSSRNMAKGTSNLMYMNEGGYASCFGHVQGYSQTANHIPNEDTTHYASRGRQKAPVFRGMPRRCQNATFMAPRPQSAPNYAAPTISAAFKRKTPTNSTSSGSTVFRNPPRAANLENLTRRMRIM